KVILFWRQPRQSQLRGHEDLILRVEYTANVARAYFLSYPDEWPISSWRAICGNAVPHSVEDFSRQLQRRPSSIGGHVDAIKRLLSRCVPTYDLLSYRVN